ncbi:MAG: hypothetical protein QY321_03635 [Patescibacteria group bacterium]|nr:MAG: hypothetical protein QY321_03635 [Patescibacteria group bacterium]
MKNFNITNLFFKIFLESWMLWRVRPLPSLYYWPLWLLVKLLWEPFSLKRSHWWTWIKDPFINDQQMMMKVEAPGDLKARPRDTFWGNFWQTNFGWQTCSILCPEDLSQEYQVGFIREYDNKKMYCSLILNGPVAILQGPKEMKFFAFSLDKKAVKIKVLRTGISKWQLPFGIPLI